MSVLQRTNVGPHFNQRFREVCGEGDAIRSLQFDGIHHHPVAERVNQQGVAIGDRGRLGTGHDGGNAQCGTDYRCVRCRSTVDGGHPGNRIGELRGVGGGEVVDDQHPTAFGWQFARQGDAGQVGLNQLREPLKVIESLGSIFFDQRRDEVAHRFSECAFSRPSLVNEFACAA
ncbi:unannotated protein [freshwater metagenome]|uniref:Unannotated protein n=1 Tax=freshwater metagenome TaxID=449393 RepID=A0A6J6HJQ9_9ZZZZ